MFNFKNKYKKFFYLWPWSVSLSLITSIHVHISWLFFLYHVLQDCSVGTVVESLTILPRATEDSKFFCSAGPSGLWNHILADQIPGHIVLGTQVPGHLVLCNRVIDTHVMNIPYMFSSLMAERKLLYPMIALFWMVKASGSQLPGHLSWTVKYMALECWIFKYPPVLAKKSFSGQSSPWPSCFWEFNSLVHG